MTFAENLFFKLSYTIASYPIITILSTLSICIIFCIGTLLLQFETSPQKLWVAEDSEINYQQLYFSQQYGGFFRINQMILKPKYEKDIGKDLFQKEYLSELFDIQQQIESINFKIDSNIKSFNLTDVCFKPIKGKSCLINSPMGYWKSNLNEMIIDKDIKLTAKCYPKENSNNNTELKAKSDNANSSYIPCMNEIGVPVLAETVFGGEKCIDNSVRTSCNVCEIKVDALIVTYLLNNDQYLNFISERWEKNAFLKVIDEYNKKEDFYFQSKGLIPLTINRMSERSIPDELDEINNQNFLFVVLSYVVMFIYIAIMMGEFNLKGTKIILALCGIIVVVLSFITAIGIISILNIKLSLISAEVVPFLILAIGIDNMFIITGTLKREKLKYPNINTTLLMSLTMKEAGPSISVASICEILAFLVGYLTNIPALQSFCLSAGFAVFVDFILQITMFVSFVVLDERRVSSGRWDLFLCFKYDSHNRNQDDQLVSNDNNKTVVIMSDDEKIEVSQINNQTSYEESSIQRISVTDNTLSKRIIDKYIDFILSTPSKIIFLFIYALLFVVIGFALVNLPLGLDQRVSVISNSDLYNYFTSQLKLVDAGPPAYIVFSGFDFQDKKTQDLLRQITRRITSQNDTVIPPIYSWFSDYQNFIVGGNPVDSDTKYKAYCLNKIGEDVVDESLPYIDEVDKLPFEVKLKLFLDVKIESKCCQEFGICGETYGMDMNFNEDGKLESSRFRFSHKPLTVQKTYIDSLIQTTTTLNSFEEKGNEISNKKVTFPAYGKDVEIKKIFGYSLFYVYFDQYLVIRGVWLENLLIAIGVIFISTQMITNISSSLIITFLVLSNILSMIGLLYLLNFIPGFYIEINAVSVVNIVMACGLSVEFIVHKVIFYLKKKGNAISKIKYSMKNVGVSVFIGIVSTKFIGVIVLGFAPSQIFQLYYFRMFICLIVSGFFHGFIILPIVLSIFKIEEDKDVKEYN